MGPAAEERLGRQRANHRDDLRILNAARNSVASTAQQREDFDAHANLLARSSIDAQWSAIEPFVRTGRSRFIGTPDWPAEMMNQPLNPMPGGTPARPAVLIYDRLATHFVGHAVAAAALTGQTISLGFSGISIPGSPTDSWERRAQIALAGTVATRVRLAGTIEDEYCGLCRTLAPGWLATALGIDDPTATTVDEAIERSGRRDELRAHAAAIGRSVERLVIELNEAGVIAHELERLGKTGRIAIDPIDVAVALHSSRWDGLHGLEVNRRHDEAVRAIAIGQAALALSLRELLRSPVFATLVVAEPPLNRGGSVPKLTSAFMAWKLALKIYLNERGELPPDEAVIASEATRYSREELRAHVLVRRHWPEIVATAQAIATRGAVELPVAKRDRRESAPPSKPERMPESPWRR
jgi:hypothetical protein